MRPGKFVGQSYLSFGRYGFSYKTAKDKHLIRRSINNLRKVFKRKYKNYE